MFNPVVLVLLSIGIVFPIIIRRAQDNKLNNVQNGKNQKKGKNKRKK